MELRVRQFRWQEQFHGIPWNLECANFADTRSSMEFLRTWSAPISLTRVVPWNSVEFHGTSCAQISLTRAVPWNSMELGVRQFRWHEQFHGIPWISMVLGVRQFRWHEQFHGIPRNLWCANFDDTSSSMELGVRHFAETSSSMVFHGTRRSSISMTRAVPWNSMELGVRQLCWHEQFHGIRWNLKCANFSDTSSFLEFHGIPWKLGCANFADANSSMEFRRICGAHISMTRAVPWN